MSKWISLLFLVVFSSLVNANGEEQLRAFLNDLDTLRAEFEQKLMNESGELLETAQGKLYLQRPGKFNWTYTTPYMQKILTDGETLWIYDQDLEQVTIRAMEQGLQATPAAILGGTANIDELYTIKEMGEVEGFQWVRLQSRKDDSQYSDVRMGFDGNKLGMMILSDNLGQTTRIDFSNVEINTDIEAERFDFTPPPDVDVIDARQQ